MSYLVLARKLRPQLFEELMGQEHVSQTLKNALEQNRLAHAFLFCGPRGVGKTSAARILAKTLTCEKVKNANSCNQCSSCNEIAKGISVDVIEIDGASNNGVDSIRDLREKAHYLPTKGQNKVYIIDEVHMLSTSAFNALLKILEEPPAHLKFIFATTEAHKIPATILSRCQKFDFKKIALTQICAHLENVSKQEKINIEKSAVTKIAKEARGSFRDALSLLDQARTFAGDKIELKDLHEMLGASDEAALFELLEHLFKKDANNAMTLLFKIYERGQDAKQLASELLDMLRALLLVKVSEEVTLGDQNPLDLTDSEKASLKNLATLITLEEMEQAFQILLKGSQEMALTLHPRFVFEATLIKLIQLRPLVLIDELLKRVESLSQGQAPVSLTRPSATSVQRSAAMTGDFSWAGLVGYVRTKKPSLAAILEHGYFIGKAKGKLTVGFAKASVFYKLACEKANVASFEKIASEALGERLSVVISEVKEAQDGKMTTLVKENDNHNEALKKNSLESDRIKETQKVFDGKVIGVKVEDVKKGEI